MTVISRVSLEHVATLRVRYSETDKMGIVYNANYLDWFEVARTELCRKYGTTFKEWEARGLGLPVVESYCRYKHPAKYDDRVELWCAVSDIKPYSLRFEYRILREGDGKLIAEGWTKNACLNESGKLHRREHPFYRWIAEKMCDEDGSSK